MGIRSDVARDLFYIDSGDLRRKIKTGNSVSIGDIAGTFRKDGYCRVETPFGRDYAHRIVWMICHGDIPSGVDIDHIDGNPRNNNIGNLRAISHARNIQNRSRCNKGSRAKFVGVDLVGTKYRARAKRYGRQITLGMFHTPEAARDRIVAFDRDWLAFLALRNDPHAQAEIRAFASWISDYLEGKNG